MAPFCYLLTAEDWPNLGWKSAPMGGWPKRDTENGTFLAAIRVRNIAPSDDERSPKPPQNFRGVADGRTFRLDVLLPG